MAILKWNNETKHKTRFEITKKLKYAITFQFQIISRNILPINMQETAQNKGETGKYLIVLVL